MFAATLFHANEHSIVQYLESYYFRVYIADKGLVDVVKGHTSLVLMPVSI